MTITDLAPFLPCNDLLMKNAIAITIAASLLSAPHLAGAEALLGPRSMSPLIQVHGFSEAETVKLHGALRYAAYGESAVGAIKMSAALVSSLGDNPTRKSAKPTQNNDEDDQCYFQIPERFKLFKATLESDPCTGKGTLLLADTNTQILYLCKNGKSVRDFDFSRGDNGMGKRIEGDEKTPLGIYEIKEPRGSSNFHTFIHISYPTALQKKNGFTGSNVGVHGPSRWAKCLGRLNTYFNWTNGCLAVASDRDIKEVSQFVIENKVTKLAVYPLEETGNSLPK